MQMVDGLPAVRVRVDDDPVTALGNPRLPRELAGEPEQPTQCGIVPGRIEGPHVRDRNDQDVRRRLRIDVREGNKVLIALHHRRGDRP